MTVYELKQLLALYDDTRDVMINFRAEGEADKIMLASGAVWSQNPWTVVIDGRVAEKVRSTGPGYTPPGEAQC